MTTGSGEIILTLDCPEDLGIVHAVSGTLLDHEYNIIEQSQYDDRVAERFFLRIQAAPARGSTPDLEALREQFGGVAERFGMRWRIEARDVRPRVLVMVSKFEHCLNDLLFRTKSGDLPIDIVAIVSNHLDHQRLAEWHGIPFFHIPVTEATKEQAEAELQDLIDRLSVDLVVLARYMQVLSDALASRMTGRVINIHHSFLPSFKGAKPYHQAHARGVKTVGATAHYVDSELDEGPIIAQRVVEVDHTYGPDDLVAAGRDNECRALSEAVRWHAECRVFLHGSKTVVLR
ncbi:formyltetrahydrofolate deformylase [Microbacterium suaedae]|uniref:formyltetrahydrofolate deformylase n=1 Tax=Microbacterium suaedae TaxID=2067813 RepID=UPI000DA23842|nr:formyltetrahydrofolate deformylase [Microbacterium suaedae]